MVVAGGPAVAGATAPPSAVLGSPRAVADPSTVLQLDTRNHKARRRARVSEALAAQGLLPDVLAAVAERAVDVLDADVAAVGLPRGSGTSLSIEVAAGDPAPDLCGMTIPAAGWHLDEVLHQGRSVVVADLGSGLHPSLAKLSAIGPCLAVPLWAGMRPYGVLMAGRHRGAPLFPDIALTDLRGLPPTAASPHRRLEPSMSDHLRAVVHR